MSSFDKVLKRDALDQYTARPFLLGCRVGICSVCMRFIFWYCTAQASKTPDMAADGKKAAERLPLPEWEAERNW
jgi:hypothetical protein